MMAEEWIAEARNEIKRLKSHNETLLALNEMCVYRDLWISGNNKQIRFLKAGIELVAVAAMYKDH